MWLWCCYHFGNWHPSCVSVCLVLLIVKLKHSREFDQTPISSESIYHLDPDIEAGAPRNISCADKELPRSNNGRANHLVTKFDYMQGKMLRKLTSMPISGATGSTTSTSSQAASLVPSSSWWANLVENYETYFFRVFQLTCYADPISARQLVLVSPQIARVLSSPNLTKQTLSSSMSNSNSETATCSPLPSP